MDFYWYDFISFNSYIYELTLREILWNVRSLGNSHKQNGESKSSMSNFAIKILFFVYHPIEIIDILCIHLRNINYWAMMVIAILHHATLWSAQNLREQMKYSDFNPFKKYFDHIKKNNYSLQFWILIKWMFSYNVYFFLIIKNMPSI